ncbi:MAG: hypothetical protein WCJ54_09100 [Actinomycetota bacterium]
MKKLITTHFKLFFIIEIIFVSTCIILIFVGAYFLYTKKITENSEKKAQTTSTNNQECKDFKCLAEAAKNCTPKKATITISTDLFGVKQTNTTFYELKSPSADKCELYTKYLDFIFEYPADAPKDAITQNNQFYRENMINKDGSCIYSTQVLATLLENWSNGDLSSEDTSKAEKCSGYIYKNTPEVPQ